MSATAPIPSKYQSIVNECKRKNILWEDPDFSAKDTSLFFTQKLPSGYQWQRPRAICEDHPEFISHGANQRDFKQGGLGDCWVLAAAANISRFPTLFQRVVPEGQDFGDSYAGVFRFRFWRYGEWVEVLVDDRLPTVKGELVYVRPTEKSEFWGPLLEKAYAKFYGSYEAIEGGNNCDSLTDFTGGVVEQYFMDRPPENFERILEHASDRKSVMSASIYGDPASNPKRENGLIEGHAYSVTGFTKVKKDGKSVFIIRIRNPWGDNQEWNGAWSDASKEWKKLSAKQKAALGHPEIDKDDGEFWMSLDDFEGQFDSVEICNLTPDALESDTHLSWAVSMAHSKWVQGVTAGGRYQEKTFYTNPQFHIDVQDYDEDSDQDASCVLQVLQKNRRRNHLPYLTLGFALYEVPQGTQMPLDKKFLKKARPVDLVAQYRPRPSPARMLVERVYLRPSRYVLIPTTWNKNEEAEFMIRVFSEAANNARELDRVEHSDDYNEYNC